MEKKTIGKFIAVMRKAKGWTQKDLAEQLYISDKTVSRWERDETVPDLALLPVLAELFDVSIDELIRGEKCSEKKAGSEADSKNLEARLEWMLKKQKAEFQVKCIISDAIAVISIIVAAICNLGFYRGTIAFFAACIGFVCAVACQVVFYMLAKQHIGVDETADERLKAYLQELKKATYKTYFVILLCFVFCLPLSLCIGRGSIYILAGSWFLHGTLWSGICLIIFILIEAIRAKNKQKISFFVRFAIAAAGTYLAFSCVMLIPPHWLSEGKTIQSYSDFKIYMQRIPPTMSDGKVQLRTRDEDFIERLYAEDGTLLCEYKPFNEDVEYIEYGENEKLPITVYTKDDYDNVREMLRNIKKLWIVTVFAEGMWFIVQYKKKKNN